MLQSSVLSGVPGLGKAAGSLGSTVILLLNQMVTGGKSLDGTGHHLVHTHHLGREGIRCSSVWVGLDTTELVFSSS